MTQGDSDGITLVTYGQIFTLFFVTFGPLKIVGPFLRLTQEADDAAMKQIAVRASLIAVGAAVIGGFVGRALITSWSIPVPALLLACWLAPNRRAVQVTTDLSGFWDRHYPAIRKELMRKYPRHSWPEDPRTAVPVSGPIKRR